MPFQKKSFILMEILVGLSLAGLLFSFLFTAMARIAKLESRLDVVHAELLARQHLQVRLQDLFMGLDSLYTKKFPKEKQESLVVVFQNGIDPDPAFSGHVLGRIYLDESQNLSLAIWPLENDRLWRKEILLSHVESFEFRFLGQKKQEEGAKAINATVAWHLRWSKERLEIPSLVRLTIKEKNTPLQFAFHLPSSHSSIIYWKGGIAS